MDEIKKHPIYQVDLSDISKEFKWDTLCQITEVIQLETIFNSIIGSFYKGVTDKDQFLILDKSENLSSFNLEGKFLRKIGNKGRGPGEYREINDFMVNNNIIYCLDYEKIHLYDFSTGIYISTIDLDENIFNTSKFLIYDSLNFYLWDSNPYGAIPNSSGYRLQRIKDGKVASEYFKFEHWGMDGIRFGEKPDLSYNLYPDQGDNKIYNLNEDSISISFELDFGCKFLPEDYFIKYPDNKSDYSKNEYFKGISNIFETNYFIYFTCIGPGSLAYEGLINKTTNAVSFGKSTFNPSIFFADNKYFYGYYESSFIKRFSGYNTSNAFFNNISEKTPDISMEDNLIIVKLLPGAEFSNAD
jgi:hypothetical protein